MNPSTKKKKKRGKKKTRPPAAPPPPSGKSPDEDEETQLEGGGLGEDEEERKALDWLMDVFSSMSIDQIVSTYREVGRDLYKAAGILGSHLEDPGEKTAVGSDAGKRGFERRRLRVVAAATGMVSDMIGKEYSKSGGHGRRSWSSRESKGVGKRTYSSEEAEEFLSSMLGHSEELGMGVVKDVLGQCGHNVEKALEALLDISAASSNIFMCGDKNSGTLCYPLEKERQFLQSVGSICRNYPNVLADSEESPHSRSGTVKTDIQQKVLESFFNLPDHSEYETSCMNWKKIVEKVESFGQGLEFRVPCNTDTLQNVRNAKEIYQESRTPARKHWDTMKAYYHKAATAYSNGQRAHAGYLSEQGKHFSKLAREADEKASREIFESRNKSIKNTITIDLHGQHVKDAIGLLKLHLLLFTYIPSVHLLKVITGCGSDGVGKGKLKHSVIGLLEKEGIRWSEENPGSLVVELHGLKECSFLQNECFWMAS